MPKKYYQQVLAAIRRNVLPLTSRCNLHCIFCSNYQNPPAVITEQLPALSLFEVVELIPFLDPQKKVVIGEAAMRINEGEPFTHPEIMQILREIRRQLPQTVLSITTNGTLLTLRIIKELVQLKPLEITISLNSATPTGRHILMHDKEPQRALAAVEMVAREGIPWQGSLVAMPHLVGWSDVNDTVNFLAVHHARTIRVFLPGYTKFAPAALQFPLSMWEKVVRQAKLWTWQLDLPVIPEPFVPGTLEPAIWGVIQGTPAKAAGLKPDDLVLAVNNRRVKTAVEAFLAAKNAAHPELTINRAGEIINFQLNKEEQQTPGFVMIYDFAPQRARAIAGAIKRYHAKRVLLLTSEFALPLLQEVVKAFSLPNVVVRAVPNQFFGGSIKAAGLITVADFLAAAKNALAEQSFDLLIVPQEPFDEQYLDLTGQPLELLSQALSVPVVAV
ncbi:MAG: DUF512 domain-containing protein [Firmicutes bacterium]|nr:DUF512 domain-containing protein [Bacillota bacterium]